MVSIPILVLATFSLVSRNFLPRLLHFSEPVLKGSVPAEGEMTP